jgi:hypothetical protein
MTFLRKEQLGEGQAVNELADAWLDDMLAQNLAVEQINLWDVRDEIIAPELC